MEVSLMEDRKKEVNKMSKYSEFLKQRKTNSLDFLMIGKEYTFDDLLEVAKSQIGNGLWFK